MRILFLTQFFDPEPASIPGMPLASWLSRRGHNVEVVTGFPNYPGGRFYPGHRLRPWRREESDGVRVNRVPLYPSHDRSGVKRILSYGSFALSASLVGWLRSRRADVVYVYHPPGTIGAPALLWKYARGMPFVYHVQDLWPESVIESGMVGGTATRLVAERLLAWWCRAVYRGASSIAVLSPSFKRILTERGVPAQKIEIVFNWAEEAIFKPTERDMDLARTLGMEGRFNIVYSGNLGHFQGLHTAILAAARLRHVAELQLIIVGSGQAEDELRGLARNLDLDNVRFLGRQPYPMMGKVTALADALLVSLEDRPFFAATIPGKTQVALACGRPVIMAVRGDAADLIRRAEAGIVCPPGDEVAMADAMMHLFNLSPSERAGMEAKARSFYEAELSLDRGASQIEDMLRRTSHE